jgi:hypothetical protein
MTCETKVGTRSEFPRQLAVSYISSIETQQVEASQKLLLFGFFLFSFLKHLHFVWKMSIIMLVKLLK